MRKWQRGDRRFLSPEIRDGRPAVHRDGVFMGDGARARVHYHGFAWVPADDVRPVVHHRNAYLLVEVTAVDHQHKVLRYRVIADLGDPAAWETRWWLGRWEPWPRLSGRDGFPTVQPAIHSLGEIRSFDPPFADRMAPPPAAAIDAANAEPLTAARAWYDAVAAETVAGLIRRGAALTQSGSSVRLTWDRDPRVWVESTHVDAADAAAAVRWSDVSPTGHAATGTWVGPHGPVSVRLQVERDLSQARARSGWAWDAYDAAEDAAERAHREAARAREEEAERAAEADRVALAASMAAAAEAERQRLAQIEAEHAAAASARAASREAAVYVPVQLDGRRYDAAAAFARGCEIVGFAATTALADRMVGASTGFGERGTISPGVWAAGATSRDWLLVVRPQASDWVATVAIRRDRGSPSHAVTIRGGCSDGRQESYERRLHGEPRPVQIGI